MAEIIKLVQGDTRPALIVTLVDESTNEPIIIAGATVRLKFKGIDDTAVLDTLTGLVLDGSAGLVRFDWNDNTLDVPEGAYQGEVEITFADGKVQTVFDPLQFFLRTEF